MTRQRATGAPCGSILHIDMDAFYAAIELLDHPELRGKPVVVGAAPNERGVVSTATYEARQYGIHSAMPTRTAAKLCPHAVFLPVRMGRYLEFSEKVMALLEGFTPMVEQVSVDEAFMDVQGVLRRWGDAVALAEALKARIEEALQLTASVGVAPNKFLAKLASDLDKPDGLTVVPVEEEAVAAFLAPMPATRIWGIGKKTAQSLARAGIRCIGDIQQCEPEKLKALLGPGLAEHIYALAFGKDERKVITAHEAKSLSAERTFSVDCHHPETWRKVLIELTEQVGQRLRKAQRRAGVCQIKFRYDDFRTFTRRRSFVHPTFSQRQLLRAVLGLFAEQHMERPLRLLGVGVSALTAARAAAVQADLFAERRAASEYVREERLDDAVDRLRARFGDDIIRRGG